jgi:hypothetical protein
MCDLVDATPNLQKILYDFERVQNWHLMVQKCNPTVTKIIPQIWYEFDIQSHEFESSIVRLDNAFFKLTNVRLKENANLTLQHLNFFEQFCILLKLLSNCVQNTNMFSRVQILDVCAPVCVLQVGHPGGVFS